MQGRGAPDNRAGPADERPVVYCLVPRDLAAGLHELLRKHFRGDAAVEVVVERRAAERRAGDDRRARRGARTASPTGAERRGIAARAGRRAAERRAATGLVEAPQLPRRARAHAERLRFVERLEPTAQEAEDRDTARLVACVQAGERDAFGLLYMRYFDRVYSYLRLLLRDPHAAEDVAQQVFVKVLEAIDGYESRRQPFRAWLFVVVRNHALNELRRQRRLELVPADELPEDDAVWEDGHAGGAFDWITDRELSMFVERLPLPQRQVLLLRYMLDLSFPAIAQVLDRAPEDVRTLHKRALGFVRARLVAVGRGERGERARMRGCVPEARVLRYRRFALSP
jgi:RNA polymerase sigma-70 factor (ECF subfamily)